MGKAGIKMVKIFSLQHENVNIAKSTIQAKLNSKQILYQVPKLKADIINNRWRAYQENADKVMDLDDNTNKFLKAALESIVKSDIIMDQRDVYYSIRGVHGDWKLSGHPLDTVQAYDAFVGTIMEKLQLVTGYTMQSLGVRAGPRGFIIGDNESYFDGVSDGKRKIQVKISAKPSIGFNLVDEGVSFQTRAKKLIHYEKAAGMDSLLVNDLPVMIEAVFMTSQGYPTESATKLQADMEKRGLPLYILGDADPHGLSMQVGYGRASKSNAYMPDCFYPKNAKLLGLFPSIALQLGLPAERITPEHERILPNLRKLCEETRPELIPDCETFENELKKWEWQALKGKDDYAPPIYMVESLRVSGNEMKYVPKAESSKATIIETIRKERSEMVEKEINRLTNEAIEPTKVKIRQKLRETFEEEIISFNEETENQIKNLEAMPADDYREAIKKKLVKQPVQYWNDAARKVVNDITDGEKFDLIITVDTEILVSDPKAEIVADLNAPDTPEKPLTIDDITESIESRVTGKKVLIQTIRKAIETVKGTPSQVW